MFTTYHQRTLFSEVLPVKDGQQAEINLGSVIPGTSGPKCSELSKKTDHESSFTKMLEEEFQKDFSTRYVVTWKVRVTKQRRSYSLLVYSVRHMNATECSSLVLWPTPTHSDEMNRNISKTPVTTSTGSIRHQNEQGEQSFMRLSQVVKFWTSPQARDYHTPSNPTDGRIQRKIEQGWTIDLNDQVRMWSTPRTSIMRTSERAQELHGSTLSLLDQIEVVENIPSMIAPNFDSFQMKNGHYLNPQWECLLMGLPPGYLDLTRLETSPDGPLVRAYTNMLMNQRVQRRSKADMRKNKSKRLAMRLYGSKPHRSFGR